MTVQTAYRYTHTVGIFAMEGRGFLNPVDMALRNDGIIYVVNRGDMDLADWLPFKRVTVCNADEDFLGNFSTGGTGDGEIMWPVSIALDQDENVYISDEALQRISVFDRQGSFLRKWGTQGSGEGEFDRPAGMAFDSDGNLLLVDSHNNRIQRYTREGRYLGGWGRAGAGDGEFNLPWGLTIDGAGNVYVADWRNDRIQKFDPDGKHLASVGESGQGDGQLSRPASVAIDGEGNLCIADWGNERVQILDSTGKFIAKYRGESGVSKWGQDYFLSNPEELAEREKADLEPDVDLYPDDYVRDESAIVEKLFWGPISVEVDSQGRLYVLESCRNRIQVYQKA